MPILDEYAHHLQNTAAICQEFAITFLGCQFDERTQAVEVFALQSLSMGASNCSAAALLLRNQYRGEAVTVLRTVQELLFDNHWILSTQDRDERLERAYRLEADPYRQWAKEIPFMQAVLSASTVEGVRNALRDIALQQKYLIDRNHHHDLDFKNAPSFADRLGAARGRYYHIYRFSSLFAHPNPTTKRVYLGGDTVDEGARAAIDESICQLVAYSVLFMDIMMGYANDVLNEFALASQATREQLYAQLVDIVRQANRGYFPNP